MYWYIKQIRQTNQKPGIDRPRKTLTVYTSKKVEHPKLAMKIKHVRIIYEWEIMG
jgi:hypothetical protein